MGERSILIIDDDQSLVFALKEGLETLGFRVATAYDALQGVMQAHQGRPDIIMLDFNMPAGGGEGVYDRLRSSTDMAKTPIVFLTGATVEEVKNKIRSTPNTFFLKKPISIAQLRKVLDKIIAAAAGTPPAPAPASAPAPRPVEELPGSHKTSPFSGMGTPAEASIPTAPPPAPAPSPLDQPLGRAHEDVPPTGFGVPTPLPALPKAGAVPPPKPAAAPAPEPAPAPVLPPAPAPSLPAQGQTHEFEMRVSYADTDRLGIVYYANYLRFFEVGRTELLRGLGIRYRDLEMERQLFLPAVESGCEYLGPCRYDETIRVKTRISIIGRASLRFQYEIFNVEAGGKLVVRGFTRHALLNAYWKPERIPADLQQKLSAGFSRP